MQRWSGCCVDVRVLHFHQQIPSRYLIRNSVFGGKNVEPFSVDMDISGNNAVLTDFFFLQNEQNQIVLGEALIPCGEGLTDTHSL